MAAAVQHHRHQYQTSMTLGNDTSKMYSMIQQHSPGKTAKNNNTSVINSNGHYQQPQQQQQQQQQQTTKSVIQMKRPLATAAPERSSVLVNNSMNIANNNSDMLRCKRKINFAHHMPYAHQPGTHQPASVARRNARERNRVKQVNNGFATLRQHIPASVAAALSTSSTSSSSSSGRGASKKLSKVETLRMAVEYIRSLQQLIQEHESDMSSTTPSNCGVITNNMDQLENEYYAVSSPQSVKNKVPNVGHNVLTQHTPPCSESSASPTPSYSSEGSLSTPAAGYVQLNVYHPESYENYEPMSPEDEELLDVISWWQQQ